MAHMAWVYYIAFYHFWTLTAPGQYSLSLNGKEQCGHPGKLLILQFMEESHEDLQQHDGE